MIRLAQTKDYVTLVALANENFGSGYLTHNQLFSYLQKNAVIWVTEHEGKVLAFCLLLPVPGKVLIKMLVVQPEAQKQGWASALLKHVLLTVQNYPSVEYHAWKENLPLSFIQSLERQGFKLQESKARYWYADSLERGYHCPICGNPCVCTLSVYSKNQA